MIKKGIISAAALVAMLSSGQAIAGGQGTVGVGSYAIVATLSGFGLSTTSTYGGSALVGSYNFTPLISASGHIYGTTLQGGGEEIGGYDAMVRFGKHDIGFTYFGSMGFFSETWKTTDGSGLKIDASGGLFGFGIGYNWEEVSLNYEFAFRSAKDYEAAVAPGLTVTETSGSLNIAYRF